MIRPTTKPMASASTIFMGVRLAICWENHSLMLASLMILFMIVKPPETCFYLYSSGMTGQGPKRSVISASLRPK